MSTSFHRSMAYGMPWHRFEEAYLGDCETHETLSHARSVLEAADDATLTVDDACYHERFYTSGVPTIWEKRLLALSDTDGGRRDTEIGRAEDLMHLVWNPADDDDPEYILFYPSLRHARRWYRRNDDMDLSFNRWSAGTGKEDYAEWETFVKEVPWGHDPFGGYLMLQDGTPQSFMHWRDRLERDDVVPAVPSELRFWLPRLCILDDDAVNLLRPVLAQWRVS